jgi:hypothetical protein
VPTVLKSGSLNLLEPYGPVQAYNGIALPLACHVRISLARNTTGIPFRCNTNLISKRILH